MRILCIRRFGRFNSNNRSHSKALNPDLEIIGVLRTMYDARNALTRDVSAELEQYFGKKLYDTVIPRNVRLAEAPAHGLPVIYFEKVRKVQLHT